MQQPLNKWRKRFMTDVLWLILSIQGKINFLQLARYGNYGEQHYRRQFEQDFDFLSFNSHLPEEHAGERKVIAFDPSHIPKSGKHTPGVGYFRSGCADQSKWGLEICGIAAIDSDNHTALHLEAVQTIKGEDQTLLEYYAAMLTSRKDALQEISKTVVADAHFSKETFVTALCKENFQVVSRLRDDVRLQYIAKVEKTGKRGRPKTNGGKVDITNLHTTYFTLLPGDNPSLRVYTAIVMAVALKRKVRVVLVQSVEKEVVKDSKIIFPTDIEADASEIPEIYQSRFQIEFIYKDAKQYTGLTNCQSREERKAFSLADIKVMNHNILLLERFFAMFAISPNILKNNHHVKELIYFGTKAA